MLQKFITISSSCFSVVLFCFAEFAFRRLRISKCSGGGRSVMTPDDIGQACHEGEGVDAHQAINGYHSVWMSHWLHTDCKSASTNRNHSMFGCGVKEVKQDSGSEQHGLIGCSDVVVDSSVRPGALGEVGRGAGVTSINEAEYGKSKKPSIDSKSFPIFNVSQKTEGILSLKKEHDSLYHGECIKSETKSCSVDDSVSPNRTGIHVPSASAHHPPKTETSVREHWLLSQGNLPSGLLMKSPNAVEQKNIDVSTSLWNEFVKSDSAVVPTVCDKGKGLMPAFTSGHQKIYQSSYNVATQEHITTTKYHSFSSLLIHEKKMSNLLDPHRSSFSRWIQDGIAQLPHNPGVDDKDDELCFVRHEHHNIHNHVAGANITNQTASLKSTKPQVICGESSLQLLHDGESMKTTHHFLNSEETDANLSDRGQFFREAIVPSKFKGNSVKLETLGGSIKSSGKENVRDLRSSTTLKNESSAETDAMDIRALHENHLQSDVPLQTNKSSKDIQKSPSSQVAVTSANENNKAKSTNIELLDINQEPCDEQTMANPIVDRETSTSRTHSLGAEHFLPDADEHGRSISGNSSLGLDSSSRWVKRLKLCRMGSACGTESVNIGECSSHEKVNNTLAKAVEGTEASKEPRVVNHAKEQMVPDPPTAVLTNGKSSFTEAKRDVEITLSHPWIQRWSHKHSASIKKRHESVDPHDPKSSNIAIEDIQKEQFPSIAAMALMGKALNCLNPSRVMKKGPVTVWNAKGF
ncbi:hypothetical protein Ahy_B03g068093 isoform B [Arachis hypogaea]|uniref:F-box protein n=1 Tax=Arachis hypogaea TaxID=3818 RepID=A0A445A8L1_ARAHY|nr:hypothetical protein Ahy_B03g068093 isoform B [Arachis hypogaea]